MFYDPNEHQNQMWAILVAAGRGLRLGGDTPKQFLPLGDSQVFQHALDVLLASPLLQGIIIVVSEADLATYQYLISDRVQLAVGGNLRQDSVANGLSQIPAGVSWVLIHDAARPFVNQHIIEDTFAVAKKTGAAVAGIPVVDTIKEIAVDGTVAKTVDRSLLYQSQTPQIFSRPLLDQAFINACQDQLNITDEAMLMEKFGIKVGIGKGHPFNFKITTASDYQLAQYILLGKKQLA